MNRISLLFCIGLYAILPSTNNALEGEGIVGGDIADISEYGYQISLQVNGRNICGGGIIDKKFVLSAAHCVVYKNGTFHNYPLRVVAGISNSYSKRNRISIEVEEIYVPKQFTSLNGFTHTRGDISVLKLKQPLPIDSNPNLSKLKLPLKESYKGENTVITGFGWNWVLLGIDKKGRLDEVDGGTSGYLNVAKAKVIGRNECQRYYEKQLTDSHICARTNQNGSNKSHGVCSGDSGGPLVYNGDTIIGTVSSSPIGCRENPAPALYTRVSSYLNFIAKAMKGITDFSMSSKRFN